jgi:cobalt-zinc-cadmium resistance protein CzcA
MNWIIDFSLRHRPVVVVVSLVLVLAGGYSLSRLSIDAFPDVTDVMVQINTVAPALGPVEIEQQITARVEQAIGGLPRLKLLRSISKYGLSQVTVVFKDDTDLYFARGQVLERLQSVQLPEGIARPEMGPIATGLGEIFHYIVTAPDGDLTHARTIQDWMIKPKLLSVPGVAEVNTWGGFEKQYQIVLDPQRLLKHSLSIPTLLEALEHSNLNVGAGMVHAAGESLIVSGKGRAVTTEDIGGVTVAARGGLPIRIRDLAEVVEGRAPRLGVVTREGRDEAVLGLGFMLMGENSHEIAGRLRDKMEEVRRSLPEGTGVEVVYDRTTLVDAVLATVRKNLLEGAILVVAVLFLFLGHFRAACIVALAIPLSMLCAFNAMLQAGVAGTLMSLGAIDFGMVADTSVILVENSVRHLRSDASGRPVVDVVRDAVKEVRAPTMFGELIIIIVYVPILALEGVEGKLFRPMALTVIFALFSSLLLSLTLMPALASYFLPRRTAEFKDPWIMELLRRIYRPVVRFAVERRLLVLGSALIVVLGTIPAALKLGAIFVPKLNEGSFIVNTIRLPGVSVDESARHSLAIERHLKRKFPDEISSIWTRTGTPEVATDPMGIEVSDVFIMLTPRERWTRASTFEGLREEMDKELRPMAGFNFAFSQPIEMRFNEMISGIRTDLGVKIFGDDFDELRVKGEKVQEILSAVPGARSPLLEPMVGQPVLEVALDLDAVSRYGLHARDVLDLVEAVGGREIGEVIEGQRRFPLALRLPASFVDNPTRLGELVIPAPDGQRLPLSKIAKVARKSGPMVISREWGKRRALVTCNVTDRDLGGFVAEARRRIREAMPSEDVEFGGQFEHLQRAAWRLTLIVPVCLTLIVLLLYMTYGNFADAVRIFTGVPLGIVGGVWALYLRDMPFSISAGVGFIALTGISVLDDMVMVSTIRQLCDEGLDVTRATTAAAERRLRAVIMTALLAILGFVPMAFNTGLGAEVQRPLATVVIGGLVSSTLLTLVVVPALYVTFLRARKVLESGPGSA